MRSLRLVRKTDCATLAFDAVVRVERFELVTKLILSQPPLPIGLHAQMILKWYSRRDSNPHCTDLESVVSCQLDYASRCWCCRKDLNLQLHGSQPCASADCATTAMMVPAFEPAASTSQRRALIPLSYRSEDWRRRQELNLHTQCAAI